MTEGGGRLCASIQAGSAREAGERAAALPERVRLVELRADTLAADEIVSGDWAQLSGGDGRDWVFTWRSPDEGGAAPRPSGILTRAVEAGFSIIDVEARALESGDAEATAVPVARRWVSRHLTEPTASGDQLESEWVRLRRHPAALHKLVAVADRFEVNDHTLALLRENFGPSHAPCTIFAQGALGHPSRILGHAAGNAVTFVAPDDGLPTAEGQPRASEALDVYGLASLPPAPRLFGVLGNPARHSRSPRLHNTAFRRCGERALYLYLESPDPAPVMRWLHDGRLRGLSVTAPFKQALVEAAQDPDDDVLLVGAVNTLWWEDGRLRGANTDTEAAFELLCEAGVHAGDPIAVVGAGGAARAVLQAARTGSFEAQVFNRTAQTGRGAARRFGASWGGPPEALDPTGFKAVVNATTLGVGAPLPASWEKGDWSRTAFLDLTYGEGAAAGAQLAARAQTRYFSGLEFLVRQGVGQFRRWTRRSMTAKEFGEGLAS